MTFSSQSPQPHPNCQMLAHCVAPSDPPPEKSYHLCVGYLPERGIPRQIYMRTLLYLFRKVSTGFQFLWSKFKNHSKKKGFYLYGEFWAKKQRKVFFMLVLESLGCSGKRIGLGATNI